MKVGTVYFENSAYCEEWMSKVIEERLLEVGEEPKAKRMLMFLGMMTGVKQKEDRTSECGLQWREGWRRAPVKNDPWGLEEEGAQTWF